MWTMRRTAWSGRALTLAVAVWLALAPAAPASPLGRASPGDAAIGEVLAFYRDLAAGDWSGVAGHFWPAKVASRWGAPAWLHRPGVRCEGPTPEPPATEPRGGATTFGRGSLPGPDCRSGAGGTARLLRPLPSGGLPIGGRRVEAIAGEAEGRWARVEVTWSGADAATARTDVLWLFEMEGRWKIVRILGAGEA
jgi:hypothetical protein